MKIEIAPRLFAFLGAFGLVALASNIISLEQNIQDWVTVWQSVVHAPMNWLWGLTGLEWQLPNWVKDYVAMGLIVTGAYVRIIYSFEDYMGIPIVFVIWPYYLLVFVVMTFISFLGSTKQMRVGLPPLKIRTFFESFLYAAVIIAFSYLLVGTGVSTT